MKLNGYTKKFVQLIFVAAIITIISPYALGRLNFYGQPQAAEAPTPKAMPFSYADAVAIAAPAVVSLKTTKEVPVQPNMLLQDQLLHYFFGFPDGANPNQQVPNPGNSQQAPTETMKGLGSGVIVDKRGYVLTNNHVVGDVDKVIVTLADGRTTEGKLIGSDPESDLAVLKIDLDKLPVIKIGSSAKLRAGDVVLAIGNPFGFDKTVTQGIISATERTGIELGLLSSLIQTDAAISPGNSGGALIDALGNLIGINTAIYTTSMTPTNLGINFAIPIDYATEIMNKLIEGKPIVRGYLGVMMAPLTPEVQKTLNYPDSNGVYVQAVVRGSPAQQAGLLPGDVITKINNVAIEDPREGFRTTAELTPGETYPLEVFRRGEYLNFAITPIERKNMPDNR